MNKYMCGPCEVEHRRTYLNNFNIFLHWHGSFTAFSFLEATLHASALLKKKKENNQTNKRVRAYCLGINAFDKTTIKRG